MRGNFLESAKNLVFREDIPQPQPDGYHVIVKVEACGICGSDLHHIWAHGPFGIVIGHEFAGTVVDPGASDLKVGDKVAVDEFNPCYECDLCKAGYDNLCLRNHDGSPGMSEGNNGGMAEYCAVRPDKAKKLPEGMSCIEGAMVEPMAVAWHANRRAKTGEGTTIVVSGAGTIGVFSAICAKVRGASYVAITDVDEERLAQARTYDFVDGVFDAKDPNFVQNLWDATNGAGFDCAIEASGFRSALENMVKALHRAGILVNVGCRDGFEMPGIPWATSESIATGSYLFTEREFEEVIQWIGEGRFGNIEQYVTKIPLEKAQEAIIAANSGKIKAVKMMLIP